MYPYIHRGDRYVMAFNLYFLVKIVEIKVTVISTSTIFYWTSGVYSEYPYLSGCF